MARLIRYTPHIRGLKELRSSRQVDEMLAARAGAVAAQARETYAMLDALDKRISGKAAKGVEVEVVQAGSDTAAPRARVAVIARSPAALRIEAQDRVLGNALDAAGVFGRNIHRTPPRKRRVAKRPRRRARFGAAGWSTGRFD